MPAKNPRPPGRPTKLDDGELGVARRTVQLWRTRAWSQRERDRPFVELERRLRDALARAEPTPGVAMATPPADDWRELVARVEANDALGWELDDE